MYTVISDNLSTVKSDDLNRLDQGIIIIILKEGKDNGLFK